MISLLNVPQISIKYKRHFEIKRNIVRTAEDAYELFMEVWDIDTIDYIENFYILLLDRGHHVLGIAHISKGSTNQTLVDSKVIFGKAILANASSIVLAHNHPSGSLAISEPDKSVTKKLKEAGKLLDIVILDHIIITSNGYTSLADENCL